MAQGEMHMLGNNNLKLKCVNEKKGYLKHRSIFYKPEIKGKGDRELL